MSSTESVPSDKFFLPQAHALPFPLLAKPLSSILQDQFFIQVLLKSLFLESSSCGDHPITSISSLSMLNRYICFALFDLSLGRLVSQTFLVACFLARPAVLEFGLMLEELYQWGSGRAGLDVCLQLAEAVVWLFCKAGTGSVPRSWMASHCLALGMEDQPQRRKPWGFSFLTKRPKGLFISSWRPDVDRRGPILCWFPFCSLFLFPLTEVVTFKDPGFAVHACVCLSGHLLIFPFASPIPRPLQLRVFAFGFCFCLFQSWASESGTYLTHTSSSFSLVLILGHFFFNVFPLNCALNAIVCLFPPAFLGGSCWRRSLAECLTCPIAEEGKFLSHMACFYNLPNPDLSRLEINITICLFVCLLCACVHAHHKEELCGSQRTSLGNHPLFLSIWVPAIGLRSSGTVVSASCWLEWECPPP